MADLDRIKQRLREELEPSKQRGFYFCPLCGSGKGSKGTAAFSIEKDGIHGKCFSCGFYGDIFDLQAARTGTELQEATRAMIEKYEPGTAHRTSAAEDFRSVSASTKPATAPAPVEAPPKADFSGEAARAHEELSGSSGEKYLQERGFTAQTMERFKLGFEQNHYFAGRGNYPAIVIPYDPTGHYIAWRAITEKHFDKPNTDKAGEEPVFNAGALYSGSPVFVVESQLCAISIEQEGGRAVAIGGKGARKLIKQLEKKAPAGLLILSLDNDEPGQAGQRELAAMLEEKGFTFIEANIAGTAKDPNDLLQHGKPGELRQSIESALRSMDEARERAERDYLEQYQGKSASGAIDGFFDEIERSKSSPAIETGFRGLDSLLDGGLYPGLYIIGAITSLGKTTFTLQVADNIAAAGHDVLFFSLEMAQRELIAKSLSRLTFELSGRSSSMGKTTLGILSGKRWSNYQECEIKLIAEAAERYRKTSGARIWFHEGVGNIGVEQIREAVEAHIRTTGRSPVVVIDYLQILAPADMRASDKQNTDKAVLELKRLSRDKGIPVFGISSLNRDNYLNPINNAAFKESGAIEYSSDVLIGLQFSGMDYQEGEADKAREKRIRELIKTQQNRGNQGGAEEIELKILKFRNGRKGTSLRLDYYPFFNFYQEKSDFIPVEDDEGNPFTAKPGKRGHG